MFTELLLKQLPKFNVKKPSTGKPLWFRPILVKEEKKLLSVQEFGNKAEIVKAVSEVMDSCYESLDCQSLPTYEFDYLFVQLRIKSIGSNINAKFTCPDTDEKINLNLDLNEIKINGIEKFNTSVKISDNMTLTMRAPNYMDLDELQIEELTYEDLLKLTARCITSILTNESNFEINPNNAQNMKDIQDMLSNMTSSQFSKIIEFFNNIPTYEHVVNYTTSDGQNRSIKISGIQDFFRLASVT